MRPAPASAPFVRPFAVDADALFRAAAAALREDRAEPLLPKLEDGVRRHPRDARLWQMLGLAHRSLEDSAAAIAAFRRAADLAPTDPLIVHSLARVTLEAGLPASTLFERALQLAPNDGQVLLGRAATRLADGRTDAAIAELDAVLARDPLWLDGHATVSRLRWASGGPGDPLISFRTALRDHPRAEPLWLGLIDSFIQAEDFAAAEVELAAARTALGETQPLRTRRAICVAEQNGAAADRLLSELEPGDPALTIWRVRHLLRSGRPADAARLAEKRLAAADGRPLWPYLASAWRMVGDARWEWLEGDPRLVGVYDLGDALGPLPALAERLRALHLASHHPLDQSLRGGTQTDGPLFARIEPEIRRLRAAVKAAVERHIAQLPPPDPRHPTLAAPRGPVRFSGSWSVRLTDGGFHVDHVHPAGWFSSAFYVALPERRPGDDPHAGWLSLGEQRALGLDLPPAHLIEPRPGRLVLFPSTMWHGTRPFAAGERLTVAFDVAAPTQ